MGKGLNRHFYKGGKYLKIITLRVQLKYKLWRYVLSTFLHKSSLKKLNYYRKYFEYFKNIFQNDSA